MLTLGIFSNSQLSPRAAQIWFSCQWRLTARGLAMLHEKQPLMEMLICGRRHQIFSVILNHSGRKENQPNILSKRIWYPFQLTKSINYNTFHYLKWQKWRRRKETQCSKLEDPLRAYVLFIFFSIRVSSSSALTTALSECLLNQIVVKAFSAHHRSSMSWV